MPEIPLSLYCDQKLKIILQALKDGQIKTERIDQAYDRIMKVKNNLLKK